MEIDTTKQNLFEEIYEIYADFKDLNDEELIECRECILSRLNRCLDLLNEN